MWLGNHRPVRVVRRRTVWGFVALPLLLGIAGWAGLAAAQDDTRAVLKVTQQQAVNSATKVVQGRVTSVDLERKLGRLVWVVELQTPAGEKDVLVDVETGDVLGTE